MQKFSVENTPIKDILIIHPMVVMDNRGYYIKSFEQDMFQTFNIPIRVHEICGSLSHKGVIRGLHFQTMHAQSKLVRCAYGELYDVAVDIRKNSETFGKWFATRLSHENNKMVYIPGGFAHGIMALRDNSILVYHSGEKYEPNYDSGIMWNDPDLHIDWPLQEVEKITVSEKDIHLQSFAEYCKDC